MPKIRKSDIKNAAKERITYLFEQAKLKYSKDTSLSNRYVTLARKIGMKNRVKMSPEQRRLYCHNCYKFLMPGKNCTVRITGKTITYSCKLCNYHNRYGYKGKK